MMTPDMQAKLKRSLILHEGYRTHLYTDTLGNSTIGIGYNISSRGLPDEWIISQYNNDVTYFYNQLIENFPWYLELSQDRQIALIDMAFMGWKHFLTFTEFFEAMARADYKEAAKQLLASEWAMQVGQRAITIASVILSGTYDI